VLPVRAGLRFPSIFRDVIQVVAFVVIALGVLAASGTDTSKIFTTSAVITAVVGLALQNTITNLFAGLMLNMDQALGVGDWIQVGARTGRIAQIRWRSTVLRTGDGDTVIMPNSQILNQDVYNYSRPAAPHRVSIKLTFHFRHPPNQVRAALLAAIRDVPGALAKPAPDCLVVEFGDGSVVYALRVWIEDVGKKSDVLGEIHTRIWYASQRAGLEMPSQTRVVIAENVEAEAESAAGASALEGRLLALDRIELFSTLERTEKELLAKGMPRVGFAAGEAIIRQGEPGDSLYVIETGSVAVSLRRAEIDQEVAVLGPGDFFGEMSLMTGEPRAATCIAQTDTTCYVIDRAGFQRIITSRPRLADEMSARLAERQAALLRKGDELSALAARLPDAGKHLLARIRSFFDLD
jgi:CRP-like cAMP-binding protein